MRAQSLFVLLVGCAPKPIPPGSPDQSIADAMRLVCDAPARAGRDRGDASRSDKIAGHLSDGVGNPRVLQTVEAWKTDGIDKRQLETLVGEAKLASCALSNETP